MIMHRKPAGKTPTPEQIQTARYLREIIGGTFAERMNEVTHTILAQMGGDGLMVPGVQKALRHRRQAQRRRIAY